MNICHETNTRLDCCPQPWALAAETWSTCSSQGPAKAKAQAVPQYFGSLPGLWHLVAAGAWKGQCTDWRLCEPLMHCVLAASLANMAFGQLHFTRLPRSPDYMLPVSWNNKSISHPNTNHVLLTSAKTGSLVFLHNIQCM